MAPQLSVRNIWIIGACAAVFVILLGALIVVLCLRRKGRASKTPRDGSTGRRANRHLSITDEDVLRMPGMRRLRSPPYSHPAGWAPISSGESVARRGLAPNSADMDPTTGAPPWPVREPRRLKKNESKPRVRVPTGALSPITERSTNNTATSPSLSAIATSASGRKVPGKENIPREIYELDGRPNLDVSPPGHLKPRPLFHGQPRSFSHGVLGTSSRGYDMNESDSAFTGDIPLRNLQVPRMLRSTSLCSQQSGQAPNIPVPPIPFELPVRKKTQLMMSPANMSPHRVSGMSLLSGDTSVLNDTISRGLSDAGTDFTSLNLASPSMSQPAPIGLGITHDNARWNFSRIDRSASPLSVSKKRDVRPQLSQQHSFRASVHNGLPRNASSGLSMSLLDRNFPTPEAARKAQKPALGLPADNPETNPTKRRSRLPQMSPTRGTTGNIFQISDEKKAKRASTSVLAVVSGNQSSPIKNPWTDRPTSIATEDPARWGDKISIPQFKPSAMKTGTKRHKRQSCVRISNIPVIIPSKHPHVPQADKTRQPSISPLDSPLPGLFLNQHPSTQQYPPFANNNENTNVRPPSTHTFNPTLPKGIRSPVSASSTSNQENNYPYSPTFSMIPLYEPPFSMTTSPTRSDSSSAPSSAVSTPTRPPRAAIHPNRRGAVFGSSAVPWPPLLSSSITPQDPPSSLRDWSPPTTRQSHIPSFHGGFEGSRETGKQTGDTNYKRSSATVEADTDDSRPPSLLFAFPSPPLLCSTFLPHPPGPKQPPPRHPNHTVRAHRSSLSSQSKRANNVSPNNKSPIRGPRPLPNRKSRILKPGFSPTLASPRASWGSCSKHGFGVGGKRERSPTKQEGLRKSILELRRMGSEMSTYSVDGAGKGDGRREEGRRVHGRYLGLGGEGEEIAEGDVGGEMGVGVIGQGRVRGPRDMGKGGKAKEMSKGGKDMGAGGKETQGGEALLFV